MNGRGRSARSQAEGTAFVRNYVIARGRTRARHMLGADTMVECGPGRPSRALAGVEYQQITALCRVRLRSVTELAGTVGVPLSVARVLISDLIDANVLVLPATGDGYEPATDPEDPLGDRPVNQLLERLRVGLIKLPV